MFREFDKFDLALFDALEKPLRDAFVEYYLNTGRQDFSLAMETPVGTVRVSFTRSQLRGHTATLCAQDEGGEVK
jgi:hypothetical protein